MVPRAGRVSKFWTRQGWVVCLIAFSPVAPMAATFTIAPDGSGDFPTIQDALNAARTGDVIALLPGTYRGPGNRAIDFLGKGVLVQSASDDPTNCVIDCEGTTFGAMFVRGEWRDAGVRGVTFTRGSSTLAGAIVIDESSPTIEKCHFNDNFASGMGGGAIAWTATEGVIRDCVFEANHTSLGGGAIYSHLASGAEISDCVFRNNSAQSAPFGSGGAIQIHGEGPLIERCPFVANQVDAGASAFECTFSATPIVRSCTFVENVGTPGTPCIFSGASSAPVFENCITAFNEGDAVECTAGITFTCSDIYGNSGANWASCVMDQAGIDGNLEADPRFCNPDLHDWTLQSDSPCAPESGSECGLIGALDVGCGPVPLIEMSWGALKFDFSSGPGNSAKY